MAVCLSGGVDSLTLAFAAQDLGLNITAYTFRIDDRDTRDYIAARAACAMSGWSFVSCDVPSANLENDFPVLAEEFLCKKKTQFECTWPFLYVFPLVQERVVVSGVTADIHYGLSKSAMIHHVHSKQAFDAYRHKRFGQANPSGVRQLRMLSDRYNKILSTPYMDAEVFDYFVQFDWREINTPQQKYLVVSDFAEHFRKFGVRKHSNFQLVAKVPMYFERLLGTALNIKGRKRVMDMCRDWGKRYAA